MVRGWNIESRLVTGDDVSRDDDPASVAPGPNLSRRRFVEIALGAVGGATLVGLRSAPAAATEVTDASRRGSLPVVRACDGEVLASGTLEGFATEVIEPDDLVEITRRYTGGD